MSYELHVTGTALRGQAPTALRGFSPEAVFYRFSDSPRDVVNEASNKFKPHPLPVESLKR